MYYFVIKFRGKQHRMYLHAHTPARTHDAHDSRRLLREQQCGQWNISQLSDKKKKKGSTPPDVRSRLQRYLSGKSLQMPLQNVTMMPPAEESVTFARGRKCVPPPGVTTVRQRPWHGCFIAGSRVWFLWRDTMAASRCPSRLTACF